MKRFLFLSLFLGFFSFISFSQSITITSPHSGQTWYKGNTYTITWTKSGDIDKTVKIRLFFGTTKIVITNLTANDGYHDWTVPKTLTTGKYYIRIKTIDNKFFDNSNPFQITNAPVKSGSIKIVSPHSGETWYKGNTYTIRWTKNGDIDKNVKIKLFLGTTKIVITNLTANDGYYDWTVPKTLTTDNYFIRIKTIDNKVFDNSNPFNIQNSPTGSTFINITSPNQGMIWESGKEHKIRWITKGISPSENLFITFFKNSINSSNFFGQETCKNTGIKKITLPKRFSDGLYYIRISSPNNPKIYGDTSFRLQTKYMTAKRTIFEDPNNYKSMEKLIPMVLSAKIIVTSPKNGDVFYKGKNNTIRWEKTGLMSNRVQIDVLDSSDKVLFTLTPNGTANDGEYKWKPTSTYLKNMKIMVRTMPGKAVKGISGYFNIAPLSNNNSLCNSGTDSVKLECLINNYRKSKGLPAIPHSLSLEKVAKAHAKDIAVYHPEKNCKGKGNEHSWSSHGKWRSGCYDPDNPSTFPVMWLKPKEIAGDFNYGYEIFCSGAISPKDALSCWKTSSAHNAVILNKGMWAGHKWKGMAAANYGSYWVVWFK